MEQAEWTLLPEAVSLFCQGRLRVEDGKVSIAPAHAGENAGAAPSEGVKQ